MEDDRRPSDADGWSTPAASRAEFQMANSALEPVSFLDGGSARLLFEGVTGRAETAAATGLLSPTLGLLVVVVMVLAF